MKEQAEKKKQCPRWRLFTIIVTVLWALASVVLYIYYSHVSSAIQPVEYESKYSTKMLYQQAISSSDTTQYTPTDYIEDSIHVILSSNADELLGLTAAVNSIQQNTRDSVKFHFIVQQHVVSHLKTWVEKSILSNISYEIVVFPLKSATTFVPSNSKSNKVMKYAKMYLDKLLPNLNGRVIYMDSDCVVQGDVKELVQTAISGKHYAAFCSDCTSVSKRFTLMQNIYGHYINTKNPTIQKLRLMPGVCSFDIGVFVTNLTKWRNHRISESMEKWTVTSKKENIFSVGALDDPKSTFLLAFYKRYSQIDPLWNVRHLGISTGQRYSTGFLKSAKLLQWSGYYKPWTRHAAYQDLWLRYHVPDPTGELHIVRKQQ